MLAFYRSGGASCLPIDLSLLSSSDSPKRLCHNLKTMDRRCCANQRCREESIMATEHLKGMLNRALKTGLTERYETFAQPIEI